MFILTIYHAEKCLKMTRCADESFRLLLLQTLSLGSRLQYYALQINQLKPVVILDMTCRAANLYNSAVRP